MLLTIALAALLSADDLNPQTAAVISREQDKAQAKVAEKYGNKKPSELSQEERREMIKDQAEADKAVLDKHGVDARDWARYEMRQGRGERGAQQQAEKALAEKEKEAEAEKAKAAKEPREIPIQKGFNDQNPVVLEEKEGALPRVDTNLPPDAVADQDATRGEVSGPPSGAKDAAKPEAPKKGAGKHK